MEVHLKKSKIKSGGYGMKKHKFSYIHFIILASSALLIASSFYSIQTRLFHFENEDDKNPVVNNPPATDMYQEERKNVLRSAQKLSEAYYFSEAIKLLEEHDYLSNDETRNLTQQLQKKYDEFVLYDGRIEHLFFHSLIVDPLLAFGPTSSDPKGYDLWMLTIEEFKKIISQLNERGYVLIMLEDVYQKSGSKWEKKDLYLPPDKKPIIFSVDNVGYTTSRIADGFASKLILDEDGTLISEVTKPDKTKIQTKEGDIFPILEDYIGLHPEFSYQDARAMLGVTGNMGILGYNPQNTQESNEAVILVNAMKKLGWEFVNHSYTHAGGDYFSSESTLEKVQEDFDMFHSIITPVIGETNIFIAPFGVKVKPEIFDYIFSKGYDVYAIVDRRGQPIVQGGSLILPRVNIDGFTMRNDKEYLSKNFFDVSSVFDSQRNP